MMWLMGIALALVVGVLMAIGIQYDQGYVMLEYQDWLIETNIAVIALFFLIVFLLLHYLLRLLVATRRAPKRFLGYRNTRRIHKAQQALSRSEVYMLEGKWSDAEWQAIRMLPHSQAPLLHYLQAARAAYQQGAIERCRKYLTQAAESDEKDAVLAADMTYAELLLERGESREAMPILKNLKRRYGRYPKLLQLLKKAYLLEGDWERLLETIRELEKRHALESHECLKLEKKAYHHLMLAASEESGSTALQILWKRMPENIRSETPLICLYVKALIEHGEEKEALKTLQERLKHHWQPQLLRLFRQFRSLSSEHLQLLEGWLKLQGEEPLLLYILGEVALSCGLWEKARGYLQRSLELEPQSHTYKALGLVMEQLQQPEAAGEYFRAGMLLTDSAVPVSLPAAH